MPASIHPGQFIGGKYRVDRVIGQGGMGVVVAAHHVQLEEQVAIKVLLPETLGNPEMAARFVQEARATVKIRSEHVVRVKDVGELDDGTQYIVMEYLEGKDLAARFAAGPISVEEIIDYVLQACEALAEAHKAGIIHRDLKPANLFLTRRADGSPLVKVLDFGISKAMGSEAALTRTAAFMGSPLYAPPEQLLSAKSADARSDVWALGVILYEAMAGQRPFAGESVMEVATRVMQTTPTDLADVRADLPPGLAAVVMKCLEKKPEARPADIGALARALGPFSPGSLLSVQRISKVMGDQGLADPLAATAAGPGEESAAISNAPTELAPAGAGDSLGTARGHALSVAPRSNRRMASIVALSIALAAVAAVAIVAVGVQWRREPRADVTPAQGSAPLVSPGLDADSSMTTTAPSATSPPPAPASAAIEPARKPVPKRPTAAPPVTAPSVAPAPQSSETAAPNRNPYHVEAK